MNLIWNDWKLIKSRLPINWTQYLYYYMCIQPILGQWIVVILSPFSHHSDCHRLASDTGDCAGWRAPPIRELRCECWPMRARVVTPGHISVWSVDAWNLRQGTMTSKAALGQLLTLEISQEKWIFHQLSNTSESRVWSQQPGFSSKHESPSDSDCELWLVIHFNMSLASPMSDNQSSYLQIISLSVSLLAGLATKSTLSLVTPTLFPGLWLADPWALHL